MRSGVSVSPRPVMSRTPSALGRTMTGASAALALRRGGQRARRPGQRPQVGQQGQVRGFHHGRSGQRRQKNPVVRVREPEREKQQENPASASNYNNKAGGDHCAGRDDLGAGFPAINLALCHASASFSFCFRWLSSAWQGDALEALPGRVRAQAPVNVRKPNPRLRPRARRGWDGTVAKRLQTAPGAPRSGAVDFPPAANFGWRRTGRTNGPLLPAAPVRPWENAPASGRNVRRRACDRQKLPPPATAAVARAALAPAIPPVAKVDRNDPVAPALSGKGRFRCLYRHING